MKKLIPKVRCNADGDKLLKKSLANMKEFGKLKPAVKKRITAKINEYIEQANEHLESNIKSINDNVKGNRKPGSGRFNGGVKNHVRGNNVVGKQGLKFKTI